VNVDALSLQQLLLLLRGHDLVFRYEGVVSNVDEQFRLLERFDRELLRHGGDDLCEYRWSSMEVEEQKGRETNLVC
jgi:hypothetical protein